MTRKPSLGIVAAQFNAALVEAMIAAATDEAKMGGADVVVTVRVPGSYELPIVAERVFARSDVDALIVLGYIERGETQHGEVMGQVVQQALLGMSLSSGKPMGLGIIGPGATPEQADLRKDAYARSAVKAALATIGALKKAAE